MDTQNPECLFVSVQAYPGRPGYTQREKFPKQLRNIKVAGFDVKDYFFDYLNEEVALAELPEQTDLLFLSGLNMPLACAREILKKVNATRGKIFVNFGSVEPNQELLDLSSIDGVNVLEAPIDSRREFEPLLERLLKTASVGCP